MEPISHIHANGGSKCIIYFVTTRRKLCDDVSDKAALVPYGKGVGSDLCRIIISLPYRLEISRLLLEEVPKPLAVLIVGVYGIPHQNWRECAGDWLVNPRCLHMP